MKAKAVFYGLAALQALGIVAKLGGFINLSWWLVLAPAIIVIALLVLTTIVLVLAGGDGLDSEL